MAFKIVISNREKTFQKEIKDDQARSLLGLKIGDTFDGRLVGEQGTLRITGGSDKEGFPMRKDVEGTRRLLMLLDDKPGFNPLTKGERRKKRVRGNTISEAIVQINTVLVEEKKPEFPPKPAPKKKEVQVPEEPAVVEEEHIEEEAVEEEEAPPEEAETKEEKPVKKATRKPAEKKKVAEKKPAKKKVQKKTK